MNIVARAAAQLRALDPSDVAIILDHLRDRDDGPGTRIVEVATASGAVRCFVARHRDGSLVLLAVVPPRQEGTS